MLLRTGHTVRNYVGSIFSKLNISDRTQAAIIAVRYGLRGAGDRQ
jgi:DNA-binding NarL/FixJ family response regulator